MKKRILALLLVCVLLVLPLAACQSKNEDGSATTAKDEVVPSERPTEKPTEQPTEKPTEQPTEKPTEQPTEKPTEAPTDKPTEAPTDKPVDPPTPTASVFSGTADTSWYTGDKTEYVLKSADQLVGFHSLRSATCTFEGVTIKLDCDVILNQGTVEEILASGKKHAWKQLNSAHQFRGTFDGQGHTISGLYMKLSSSAVRGMFGGIGGNAVIKNFTLTNTYYGGPTKDKKITLGAIAAKVLPDANVTISNVSVTAIMEEDTCKFSRIGGMIGNVDAAATVTLENCEFNGSISITGDYAGGMIGYVSNADAVINLTNCKNTASITANSGVGGMIGSCTAKELNMTGCTNSGVITAASKGGDLIGENAVVKTDPTNGARPATPEGKTALRVMSFNIQSALTYENDVLTDAARNRIEAVSQEILFYAPDLIGFQEDSPAWHQNLVLSDYERIVDPTIASTTELCGIYYKKGMKLLDSGTIWITRDGTSGSVALSVADLTTEGSKYKLSDAELAELGITKDSPDSTLTAKRKYDENTSYVLVGPRKMSWGVFEVNGQIVIYINTHLQHRSQGAVYSTPAIQKIRSMERVKQFELLQKKLAELKGTYAGAVDFVTGDFNDLEYTDIFNSATKDYGYSSAHLVAAEKYGANGSWNSAFDLSKQGDNYPSSKDGTSSDYLDYCFVSDGIDVLKFRVGAGKAEITAVDGTKKTLYTSDHLPIITDLCFKTEEQK